ncbi:MAG: hypothetical protein JWM78_1628 [Verrucomicrobiaceae bacterium]|nr:hypothetical protein [Verrucomicrobiaceae bacterium]
MQTADLPVIGSPLEGGFYAGKIRVGEEIFAIIAAPKAEGEHAAIAWGERGKDIPEARSFADGRSNTLALLVAKSPVAEWVHQLQINGFTDWYLPSRDELEIIYRNLKPTDEENYTYRHGENVSAVPPTYAYTEELPTQTGVEIFKADGDEAFDDTVYWSSTQYSADSAWYQGFDDGFQSNLDKGNEFRARAVRRLLVIQ